MSRSTVSTTQTESPIAWDMSPDMNNPMVICDGCTTADDELDDSQTIYAGDEWGASDNPRCERCGCGVVGLDIVSESR